MATEQDAWRAVHVVAAEKGLDDAQTADLRIWAGERMRAAPYAVWRFLDQPPHPLRNSFSAAIGHAANDLIAGRQPE